MIQPDMDLEILTADNYEEFREKLLALCKKYGVNLGKKAKSLDFVREQQKGKPRLSIVIDGPTLVWALKDE